jgi:hypothetical protein
MKIMIEVSGGVVTNIVATGEVSVYLVDHDNIIEKGDSIDDCIEAMQPYRITWEETTDPPPFDATPDFDDCLREALSEHIPDEVHDREEAGTMGGYA